MRKCATVALAAASFGLLGVSHSWATDKWEEIKFDPYCFTKWEKTKQCRKDPSRGVFLCRYRAQFCAWADNTTKKTGYTCKNLSYSRDKTVNISTQCLGPYSDKPPT
jgi:hypothetical protein